MIVNTNPELSSIVKRVSEQFSQKFKGDNTPTLQSPSYLIKNSDMLKTKNLKDLSIINTLQNVQKLHPKQGWEIKNLQLSFCYEKWVGGCLTNWKQISKSAITFATLAQRFEKQFRDKEINLPQYLKMKESFQGIVYYNDSLDTETALPHLRFSQKPDLLLLLQPDPTVLREARRLHIPVIVFTDSKTDLSTITYPIPSNTASPRFIYKCLSWIYKIQTLASRP